ncbi:unnamed protein product [Symbiodinium sp. CCMP2592]|nr:unnamed protein product [Symbiodinium sp. CCMP2592]
MYPICFAMGCRSRSWFQICSRCGSIVGACNIHRLNCECGGDLFQEEMVDRSDPDVNDSLVQGLRLLLQRPGARVDHGYAARVHGAEERRALQQLEAAMRRAVEDPTWAEDVWLDQD